MRSFGLLAGTLLATASTLATTSKLNPPVLPLIVRNPYLSTWLQPAREAPWEEWPMFYTGQHIGMAIMAYTENGVVYPLLGRTQDALQHDRQESDYTMDFPEYLGTSYDASTTNLTYLIPAPDSEAKPAQITLSFLSPVTPTSTLRQSIPASYLSIHVQGTFNVDVYVDLNGQWVSGDRNKEIVWKYHSHSYETGPGLKMFEWHLRNEQILTEHRDRAEWGTCHFTASDDVSHEIGISRELRERFARHGKLRNHEDNRFRRIMDEEPVFAFAKHFKLNEENKSGSTLFTIAHIQNPVVQYAAARGLTLMRPLWASFFPSSQHLLEFHYFDFPNAVKLSSAYSEQLDKDAYQSGAQDYVNILALSARQVLGATSFSGTPDSPILFLKEISSNGNFQTIDVIFPSFPFFLYTNPRWLAYLIEPLIEHMLSGQYPNDYAMHDLGTHFPNATGHPDGRDEYMPVEECGNILMMGLAIVNSLRYENASGNGLHWAEVSAAQATSNLTDGHFPLKAYKSRDGMDFIDEKWGGHGHGAKQAKQWVERSYSLWKQWTGYLVKYSLLPENQLCTDDFAGWLALQTNLALKGIIGIRAMSELASIVGETSEAEKYRDIAYDYIGKWEEYGISRDKTHAKLAYNWYGSWTTIYNIYGDALLCFILDEHPDASENNTLQHVMQPGQSLAVKKTGFVPQHIYTMQSDWYYAVRQRYGLPLDSRHLYTKTDWEFFAMAVTSKKTRSTILESVAKWVNETETDRPFTDLHKTEEHGGFPGPNFFARPVIGGHFAFLTLERACGGKAIDALNFLETESSPEQLEAVKVAANEYRGKVHPYQWGDPWSPEL